MTLVLTGLSLAMALNIPLTPREGGDSGKNNGKFLSIQQRQIDSQEGDEQMKKRSWVLTTVLTVAVLLSSVAAVSAQPNAAAPTGCVIMMAADQHMDGIYWYGSITGCSLAGTIRFDEKWDENYRVGTTEHFFETFIIKPAVGGEITGVDEGVWNVSTTFKFRANGLVTSASSEWEDLIGYKFHEMGTTSDPAQGLPITALDTVMTLHAP